MTVKKLLILVNGVLFLQVLGQVGIVFQSGSHIESFFFMEMGVDPSVSGLFDRVLVLTLLLGLTVSVFNRQTWVLLALSLYFLTDSILDTYLGGSFAAPYAIAAHGVRFCLPLAAIKLKSQIDGNGKICGDLSFERSLCIALSLTFFAHGLEAIFHNPGFLDLIMGSSRKFLDFRISEYYAKEILSIIGFIDIALAMTILFGIKSRLLMAYMLFWGLITAFSRILYFGDSGIALFFVRAANWGVPLAILILWHYRGIMLPISQPHGNLLEEDAFSPAKSLETDRKAG
jgi:hypothetical protein